MTIDVRRAALLILGIWTLLNFVLPRFGVPT